MMINLASVHGTPCIPSLTSSTMYECHVMNNVARCLVLMHAAIQVNHCLSISCNAFDILMEY